jgi:O-antigen/teichoic acid export membrane protein
MSAVIPRPVPTRESGLDSIVPHARLLSVSQVIRRLFRMAILFLAARMLGVESFGSYAVLLTIVEMVAIISGYGYMDFLTREVAQHPETAWPLGKKVTGLRLAYIVPSIGLALLVLFVLRFPSSLILNAALLAVTLIPRAAGESAQGLLKGLRRFGALAWIESAQGSMVLTTAPVLILQGLGIKGVIVAEIVGAITGTIISVWTVAPGLNRRASDHRNFRELLRSTLAFNIYPFIATVYDRADVVLLSYLAGNFATGIYSLPYRAFATLSVIPYGVMGALLPVFSASKIEHAARETCAGAMKFLFLMALLVVLLALTFASPVVLFFLGQSYAESILTIKILVWASIPAFLNYALNTLLLAAHKEKVFLWTVTICTVFNITANLLLIPRFSFVAAAVVTVLTEILLLFQNFYLIRKFMGAGVFPKDGLKITSVFAAVLAGSWGLQRAVPQLWVGSLTCAVFAIFAVKEGSGLHYFRPVAGQQGTG